MKSHADRIRKAISDLGRIDLDLIFEEGNAHCAQDSEEELLLKQLQATVDSLRTSMRCIFDRNRETSIIERFEYMAEVTLRNHANNSFGRMS